MAIEHKPSDFTRRPINSIFQKVEAEIVAANIMIILKRKGNEFRPLSFEEYKEERIKDGNFSEFKERLYFNKVQEYCENAEQAQKFSPEWKKVTIVMDKLACPPLQSFHFPGALVGSRETSHDVGNSVHDYEATSSLSELKIQVILGQAPELQAARDNFSTCEELENEEGDVDLTLAFKEYREDIFDSLLAFIREACSIEVEEIRAHYHALLQAYWDDIAHVEWEHGDGEYVYYMTLEQAREELSLPAARWTTEVRQNLTLRRWAEIILESYAAIWKAWADGEVYGVVWEHNGKEEQVHGFYSLDTVTNGMREYVPEELWEELKEAENNVET